jgi:ABC-type polysaccharide/polyol phosphate export permease
MTDVVLDTFPDTMQAHARVTRSSPVTPIGAALSALVRRRAALSVRTPRELFVPLLTPVLFALVIAPALDSIGPKIPGLDYMSFAAIGTAVLLIPLNCMFAGVGVIVDRETGARRDLLAAPVPRPLIVLANLVVAFAVTSLQIVVLIAAAVLRGAELDVSASGIAWFVAAAALLILAMYGLAETVANRMPSVEEYIAAVPALAIVPFFFAGALFPITAMPRGLAAFARVLPATHALALMRYGLLGGNSSGLHDIWGMHNATAMAALSLGVVALFAAGLTFAALRTFRRTAVS